MDRVVLIENFFQRLVLLVRDKFDNYFYTCKYRRVVRLLECKIDYAQ
jgi:hypothetical protein